MLAEVLAVKLTVVVDILDHLILGNRLVVLLEQVSLEEALGILDLLNQDSNRAVD